MSVNEIKGAFIAPYDLCTGCGACSMSCSLKCITMVQNKEGFFFPEIDTQRCISCDKCRKVCPQIHNPNKIPATNENSFIVQSKNKEQSIYSSSGGVFAAIAQWVIEKKQGAVFGASLENDFSVKTICIEAVEDIKRIQGSKYVQASTEDSYLNVKSFLKDGRWVLFSGTPCQVSGLYAFLGQDYDRLITLNIICHGVASPGFFKRYIEEAEKESGKKLEKVTFRTKFITKSRGQFFMSHYFMSHYFMSHYKNKHKKPKPKIIRTENDVYFNLYLKGKAFRESCYNCYYACIDRIGDFTIGDCDSQGDYKFHFGKSNSTVILSSEKSKSLWQELNQYFDYEPLDLAREAKRNRQLSSPFKRPAERDDVYNDLNLLKWDAFKNKYSKKQTIADQFKIITIKFLPQKLYMKLIKIFARLKGSRR